MMPQILTRFQLQDGRARQVMARLLRDKGYFSHPVGGLFVDSLLREKEYGRSGYQKRVLADCGRFADILAHCGSGDAGKLREWQGRLEQLQGQLFSTWVREPAVEYITQYLEWELQRLCEAANRRQRDDLETIRVLAGHFDLNRQEEADRLYGLLLGHEGSFFDSWVGEGFAEQLQKHTSRQIKRARRVKLLRRTAGACILAAVLALVLLGHESLQRYKSRVMEETLDTIRHLEIEETNKTGTESTEHEGGNQADKGQADSVEADNNSGRILNQYEGLYRINPDLFGWLEMEGTGLSLPVVQSLREEDFYLSHGFDRRADRRGALFVDADCSLNPLSSCIVVYGHHMGSGDMFGSLEKYKREEFWREHTEFAFDTIYETGRYEIAAVLLTCILKTDEEGFRYYRFHGYENEREFDEFARFVEENRLYDTGVELAYGDSFVVLSTCEYSGENGRLLVVGKRKEDI